MTALTVETVLDKGLPGKSSGPRAGTSDEDLMAAIAGGDAESFRVLADRYMRLLYAVAFRMFPQKADAEDIVQEALLRLWSKAHLWKADAGAAVSTWLYRLVYNICIDHKRRGARRTEPVSDAFPDSGPGADRTLENAQTRAIVMRAVRDLPERQRAALVLCHYQGLSNAEAADIMGTSVKGVEGLLVRARKTLHRELKSYKGVL